MSGKPQPVTWERQGIDREALAWAAGFIDGEGSFVANKDHHHIQLAVCQIDKPQLDRLQQALGLGKVNGPHDRTKISPLSRRPQFFYQVGGFEKLQAIIAMLWPWLGEPKRQQAQQALRTFLG